MSSAPDDTLLRRARTLIVEGFLGTRITHAALGEIVLRPHQERAVSRLLPLLRRDGGALLADATGLGKTYVALAVAREFANVLVVAPASLHDAWTRSIERARVAARVVSMESLSRQDPARQGGVPRDLVVIDEAHHFRTTSTRRYAVAAELCRRAPVLLLSATPVQNKRHDLSALLALFLGSVAWSMTDAELAHWVIRRDGAAAGVALPAMSGPHWLSLPVQDDWLDALLALPSPTPATDEGDGGALVVYSLVRQWASSRAALVAGLRRRLARATAMGSALDAGRLPSHRELAAWTFADDALQLAFPELLASTAAAQPIQIAELRRAVRLHEEALRGLLSTTRSTSDPDVARADLLHDVSVAHAGERVIAFSQFTETVHSLGGMLRRHGGVAELTASGARVAGGRITRREVLAQFSPDCRRVSAAERINMLVTTDVLSEGLDMQRASVIIHLDLPWNPARLEQRVGRVRRIGSSHPQVSVYVLAPPVAAERLLRVEQRLRDKLGVAGRVIGPVGRMLPGFGGRVDAQQSAAETITAISDIVERWREQSTPSSAAMEDRALRVTPFVVAIRAPSQGFIAILRDATTATLLVSHASELTADAAPLLEALKWIDRAEMAQPSTRYARELGSALESIAEWWRQHRANVALDMTAGRAARTRRRIAERIAIALSLVPRHRRAPLATVLCRARDVLRLPLGAAAEDALAALAAAPVADEQWLIGLATFGELHRRSAGDGVIAASSAASSAPITALILLVPR